MGLSAAPAGSPSPSTPPASPTENQQHPWARARADTGLISHPHGEKLLNSGSVYAGGRRAEVLQLPTGQQGPAPTHRAAGAFAMAGKMQSLKKNTIT